MASSNSGFVTVDNGRGDYGTECVSSYYDIPNIIVNLRSDDKIKATKGKLEAIGTMLEKSVVRDPYKAPNSQ